MFRRRLFTLALVTALAACVADRSAAQNPAIQIGIEALIETTSFGPAVGLDCPAIRGTPVGLAAIFAYGFGNQDFGQDGGYNVIKASARARYEFPFGDDESKSFWPVVGAGFYRWSADYGAEFESPGFSASFDETNFVLDLGAGGRVGPVSVEAFTVLDGPDFGVTALYNIPLRKKNGR